MNNKIIIVSGLPRSGTSMTMKILKSSGLDVLFDKNRNLDNNNPNGYFELKNVKKLINDNDWLLKNKGKVVKYILYDLPFLPQNNNFNFDIIYMYRSLIEIAHSMSKYQFSFGKNGDKPVQESIKEYRNLIKEIHKDLDNRPNIRKLDVNYNKLIKNPDPILKNIKEFLNRDLDLKKMKSVIDPKLYRNRISDISKTPYLIPQNKRMLDINNVQI